MIRFLAPFTVSMVVAFSAGAAPCPGNPDALGTSRVMSVDAVTTPRVGRKSFLKTLPLAVKEVVLTFDDGPWPGITGRVLNALKHECVRATFFVVGQNSQRHPALVKREVADGHTVGHHTFSHPLLNRMTVRGAQEQIDRGFAADDAAAYGQVGRNPRVPFFRFPGFASSPALLDWLARRRIVVFGADFWASDWNTMTPDQELRLVLRRLQAAGRGIILFHDTRAQTAAMLPAFLRALKMRGYRVVHVVPAAPNGAAIR